ncbi:chromate transporter [Thalassorhabdus alkalitolerans]|uniref:Chromate transporter n=1 Tax=Thalassorhabdus alkalitolerans TaxID=2282697 RepID=A0ABW0YLT6_9BACI|nr:chromate transporter [Thalassobacillus sp. C254]
MLQMKIFLAFFRVGILGYGGGPASIPLVYKEVVDHYKWLSEDEFGDILALGNTLPGPIVTKLAGYIGFSVGGVIGAINGVIAIVMPTALMMIAFFAALANFQDAPWVTGLTNGVLPVVTVMMAVLTKNFVTKSHSDLGWKFAGLLLLIGIVIIGVFDFHPAILIVILIIAALIKRDPLEKKIKGREGGKEE